MVEYSRAARPARRCGDPPRVSANTLFRASPLRVRGRRLSLPEIFDPPDSVTLWRLPEAIEEEFEAKWEHWLDRANEWQPFFHRLENLQENDLKIALRTFDAVTDHELEMSSRLRRSAEGRAVPLSEPFSGTDQDIALLALGFARGETGSLAVPYARRGNA